MNAKQEIIGGIIAIAALLVFLPQAIAAPINYGDFDGTTVMYLDVTETANTPDDDEPLFGPPTITGDLLDFDPAGFIAFASSGGRDATDGQLNFDIMVAPGDAINIISITEGGDYTLAGTGGRPTQVIYGVGISSITVLEVDGVALGTPTVLPSASVSGGDNLGGGADVLSPWSLSLNYDVNAALAAAQIPFNNGATKLELVIDNLLIAQSEPQSTALITKKDFRINVDIPEPATFAIIAFGGAALLRRRG